MKRLAIAIPTYNRENDIKVFLDEESFLFDSESVDILIFDSGTNGLTRALIEQYSAISNIKYFTIDSSISSNEKVYRIYQQLDGDYEYIWITHDHTVFSQKAYESIDHSLQRGYDFLFLSTQKENYREVISENDNDFLYNSAWLLGKIGAAIAKSDTFIKGIDWDRYYNKYLTSDRINFSQIGLYFERIAELDQCKIVTLEIQRGEFVDTHKYEKLSWNDEVVRICTECWGSVIEALPSCYTNKDEVLKTIDSYFLTKYKLMELKEKKKYDIKSFVKYGKWIKKVFPKLYSDALLVAVLPLDILVKKYKSKLLKSFGRDEISRNIYIYGAGKHGIECLEAYEVLGVDPQGFVVTDKSDNPEEIRGYKVLELSSLDKEKNYYIVIAVMNPVSEVIEKLLQDKIMEGYKIQYSNF